MPVLNLNRYTCPVTGDVAYGTDLPPKWFQMETEVFSPNAQLLIAQYVVAHPDVGFSELIAVLTARPANVVGLPGAERTLKQ